MPVSKHSISSAIFGLILLLFFTVSCELIEEEPFDLSEYSATERPTWTPEPTQTPFSANLDLNALTSEPSDRPAVASDARSDGVTFQVSELIGQLEKLQGIISGLDQIDVDTQNAMDGSLSSALSQLTGSDISGEAAQGIYDNAMAGLSSIAASSPSVSGISESNQGAMAAAGADIGGAAASGVADALAAGNLGQLGNELANLATVLPTLSPADFDGLAADLLRAAEGIQGIDVLLYQAVLSVVEALQLGDLDAALAALAIAQNIANQLAQSLTLTSLIDGAIVRTEQETKSLRSIRELVETDESTTVDEVEFVELDISRNKMTAAESFGTLYDESGPLPRLLCGLMDNGGLLCRDRDGKWESPQLFEDGNKPFSAIVSCGDTFVLATADELVLYDGESITSAGEEAYPFKPPSALSCLESDAVWALPSDDLAENPWFYNGEEWEYDRHILQNRFDMTASNEVWGIKWEVNEQSPFRDGKPIDFTPFVSRWQNGSWALFYSSTWEEGLWGVAAGAENELWFAGDQLVHRSADERWYRYPGGDRHRLCSPTGQQADRDGA